jgi:hypothetical protein
MIRCGYCGYEFIEEEGIKGCGRCGKPCRAVRRPRCFYENPPELPVVKKLKKLIKKEH